MQNEIAKIREVVINRVAYLTAIFLTPAYLMAGLRSYEFGWKSMFIYYSILYVLILFVSFFRKRLKFLAKIIILTAGYLLIAISALYNFAFSAGYFYIIISIAILSILINRKYAIYTTIFIFVVFVLVGVGYVTNYLSPITNLNDLTHNVHHWATTLVAIFSLIIIFIFAFGDVFLELMQAFHKKEESEEQFRTLAENVPGTIYLCNNDETYSMIYLNDKVEHLTGYPKEEFLTQRLSFVDLYHPEDKENVFAKVDLALEKKESFHIEYRLKHKSGKWIWIEEFGAGIYKNNELQLLEGFFIDVTDKKKNEKELENYRNHLEQLVSKRTLDLEAATEEWKSTSEDLALKNNMVAEQNAQLQLALKNLKETQSQLLQAEKMASLGTLTAGVSHEINNPLNYLSWVCYGFSNYFKKYGSSDEQTTNLLLKSTETAIKRISSIVKGLNEFSSDHSDYDEDCDVHAIIENCLTVLYSQFKNKVEVIKDFGKQEETIKGNVSKLYHVITNILLNSIQSIEKEGQIIITTRSSLKYIEIEIKDTGCGISKENLSKVTDPFFTTKPPGEGTGLGLSLVYSVIKEHKGIFTIESEIEKGTKAIIQLPLKRD